jgi:hypothetical protein
MTSAQPLRASTTAHATAASTRIFVIRKPKWCRRPVHSSNGQPSEFHALAD